MMLTCGCVTWREIKPGTSRPDDILKQVKPTLTPHYFRHNYVTLLYESGVDPLIAMKIVGHTDYQTTANIAPTLWKRRCAGLRSIWRRCSRTGRRGKEGKEGEKRDRASGLGHTFLHRPSGIGGVPCPAGYQKVSGQGILHWLGVEDCPAFLF